MTSGLEGMKFADLSMDAMAEGRSETIAKIKTVRWDRILEKHEGPER